MIRMLALDLDETTLRSDGTISLYTMQTLQRAAAQGVILVAASGRPAALAAGAFAGVRCALCGGFQWRCGL
ncbi:MAG: HAD family hydrolase [Ruminococcus sp.]